MAPEQTRDARFSQIRHLLLALEEIDLAHGIATFATGGRFHASLRHLRCRGHCAAGPRIHMWCHVGYLKRTATIMEQSPLLKLSRLEILLP